MYVYALLNNGKLGILCAFIARLFLICCYQIMLFFPGFSVKNKAKLALYGMGRQKNAVKRRSFLMDNLVT
jgi:hypothetical protein